MLTEEPEVDNEGFRIPSTIRWLGRATEVKASYNEETARASSAISAVLGEAKFSHLRRSSSGLYTAHVLPARCRDL